MLDRLDTPDERLMRVAITLAFRSALDEGDMPFAALAVADGTIIASASSTELRDGDRTAHAELHVIRQAAKLAGPDLGEITLYSTHELCAMCSCAALHAGVGRIVIGSERTDLPHLFRAKPAVLAALVADSTHQPQITTGVLRDGAIALLDACLPALLGRPRRPLASLYHDHQEHQ
ncbi:MAG: nucleoside deaminase [Solirubrobacteraceae bacterium]|nr:nucleoside deaminase [Solirubrobacteraceae bacterium]